MGIFDRLFKRGGSSAAVAEEPVPEPVCPHSTMTPRWDSVADMGKIDRVTLFRCEGCKEEFTPDRARELGIHPEQQPAT